MDTPSPLATYFLLYTYIQSYWDTWSPHHVVSMVVVMMESTYSRVHSIDVVSRYPSYGVLNEYPKLVDS